MKKIFTLLAVIMASLTAMAQTTFYGTWKNNSNSFPSFDNYVEVTVNDRTSSSQPTTSTTALHHCAT